MFSVFSDGAGSRFWPYIGPGGRFFVSLSKNDRWTLHRIPIAYPASEPDARFPQTEGYDGCFFSRMRVRGENWRIKGTYNVSIHHTVTLLRRSRIVFSTQTCHPSEPPMDAVAQTGEEDRQVTSSITETTDCDKLIKFLCGVNNENIIPVVENEEPLSWRTWTKAHTLKGTDQARYSNSRDKTSSWAGNGRMKL